MLSGGFFLCLGHSSCPWLLRPEQHAVRPAPCDLGRVSRKKCVSQRGFWEASKDSKANSAGQKLPLFTGTRVYRAASRSGCLNRL